MHVISKTSLAKSHVERKKYILEEVDMHEHTYIYIRYLLYFAYLPS